jgi:hypothetical protein
VVVRFDPIQLASSTTDLVIVRPYKKRLSNFLIEYVYRLHVTVLYSSAVLITVATEYSSMVVSYE